MLERDRADRQVLPVVCEDVEGEALATLVVNKFARNAQAAALGPGFGDRRKEMAA